MVIEVRNRGRARPWRVGVLFLGMLLWWGAPLPAADPPCGALETRAPTLAAELDSIFQRDVLRGAHVGVEIRSLTQDEVLYRRQSGQAVIPASNQKLLTLALGLTELGPDFHFETALRSSGAIDAEGRLHGDLWLVGGGDPTLSPRYFDSERPDAPLRLFVEALRLRGVRRIEGDLVVDDRLFDDQLLGPQWPPNQEHKDYCAPVCALSLNSNCLTVRVRSDVRKPHLSLEPATGFYRLDHGVSQSRDAREMLIALARPDPEGLVRVRGSVGPSAGERPFPIPVLDPAKFFGHALASALSRAGIDLRGEVRRPGPQEQPAADSHDLYVRRSPLYPALLWCGKESDNLVAEHVFKRVGAQRESQGSFASGGRALLHCMEGWGLDARGLVVADGSGLSRLNRISPALMVGVLKVMYDGPHRDAFVRCLAISGVDGTLDQRMREPGMSYRVRAKTGYLSQVSGLSGFVLREGEDGEEEVLAFSILINGFRHAGNSEMKRVQDDACRALVARRS